MPKGSKEQWEKEPPVVNNGPAVSFRDKKKPGWMVNNGLSVSFRDNKVGYTATEVACGWAGAIFEVTRLFGQE